MIARQPAFTLIEAVVSVGIFAILATTVSLMLFAALRGANKVSAVAQIRSEGAYVMGVMSQMLRYADGPAQCGGAGGNAVTVVSVQDQQATTFSCLPADPADPASLPTIASNGVGLLSNKVQYINCTITCSPGGDIVYINFTLAPAGEPESVLEAASVTFDSQIQLRNVR